MVNISTWFRRNTVQPLFWATGLFMVTVLILSCVDLKYRLEVRTPILLGVVNDMISSPFEYQINYWVDG